MNSLKLHRLDRTTADGLLAAELAALCAVAVMGIVRGESWVAVISGVVAISFLAWRFWRGPLAGPVIVDVGDGFLGFNDPVFRGKVRFALADVAGIRIVGPRSDRRIRVHLRAGAVEEAYRGLGGKRLARIVAFLRSNLPASVPLLEEEAPGLIASLRREF